MKYIIFESVRGTMLPVLFPEIVTHSAVGERCGGEKNILSAGFANFRSGGCDGEPRIYVGKQASRDYPNKPPQKGDDEILNNMLENY